MESIQEELKAAVTRANVAAGWRSSGEWNCTASRAIDSYFSENLEEEEVAMHRSAGWCYFPCSDRYAQMAASQGYSTRTILRRKKEPEKKLEVTRESLAVLAEHYRDTPGKSDECDRAAAEADRLLKR